MNCITKLLYHGKIAVLVYWLIIIENLFHSHTLLNKCFTYLFFTEASSPSFESLQGVLPVLVSLATEVFK